jgi:AAA domain
VGDKRQHEAVEAGRPYHQLQQVGMQTARLDEIVRQRDPALKEVVEQLARGDVFGAIDNLDRQGRVHEIVGRDTNLLRTSLLRVFRSPAPTLLKHPSRRAFTFLTAMLAFGIFEAFFNPAVEISYRQIYLDHPIGLLWLAFSGLIYIITGVRTWSFRKPAQAGLWLGSWELRGPKLGLFAAISGVSLL